MNLQEHFKGIFEPALLKKMAAIAEQHSLKEGDVFIDIGQRGRMIPLVLKGSLKISRLDAEGHELLLYYVNPNQSCAMTFTCCMQQFPSEVRARAEEDVELLAIPIAMMDTWLAEFSSWKCFVMHTMRVRFNELLGAIDQLAFQNLDERLIHYLKEKSKVTGSNLINLSHEQIAREMASSREVISRLLKKLENDRKVILYRNQVKLLCDL